MSNGKSWKLRLTRLLKVSLIGLLVILMVAACSAQRQRKVIAFLPPALLLDDIKAPTQGNTYQDLKLAYSQLLLNVEAKNADLAILREYRAGLLRQASQGGNAYGGE